MGNIILFVKNSSAQRGGGIMISIFAPPVSNTTNRKVVGWPELFDELTGKPTVLQDNDSATKAKHGAYYVRGLIDGAGLVRIKKLLSQNSEVKPDKGHAQRVIECFLRKNDVENYRPPTCILSPFVLLYGGCK